MKIQILKQELLKILQLADEASEKNNINSYYSYFIFQIEKNLLTIKSANRQLTFEESITPTEENKLKISEDGAYLVPGNKIVNIVNSLHDGPISLETQEMNLQIVEEGSSKKDINFKIRLKNIEDYPKDIHTKEKNAFIKIDKQAFYTIINNTSFAVSSNLKDSSMFLTGVFFDINDKDITAVATDRNRMSISTIQLQEAKKLKDSTESDIIIPLKSIHFIKKIIQKFDQEIDFSIAINKENVYFKIDNILITTNLITGKFYDYKKIIPTETRNTVLVNTQDLKDAINRVTVISNNRRDNSVKINIENNQVIVSVDDKESGVAKESLEATTKAKAKDVDGNFLIKSMFLLDPLSIITTEQTCIDYGQSNRDLIKITSVPEDNTLHIMAQQSQ